MGAKTGISWTGSTWNWLRGCSRCSTGCIHCYAETIAGRFSDEGQAYHGFAERRLKVITDDDQRLEGRWTGKVEVVFEHLRDPLRWQSPRKIFVNSTSDTFHEEVPYGAIALAYLIMAAARRHTFQVLTKRARRRRLFFECVRTVMIDGRHATEVDALASMAREWLRVHRARHPERLLGGVVTWIDEIQVMAQNAVVANQANRLAAWPLPNVWEGTSVENQKYLDERVPELLATPAAVRFLSCEPLLGPLDLVGVRDQRGGHTGTGGLAPRLMATPEGEMYERPGLDWIIAGCESGRGARPADLAWFASLRDQCASAGVPFFLKQAVEPGGAAFGEPVVTVGPGSKVKQGGVVELPYLDGFQHAAFPA